MCKIWQGSQGEPGFPGLQGGVGVPGFKGHKVRYPKTLLVKGVICVNCAISFAVQWLDVQSTLKYKITRSISWPSTIILILFTGG